MTFSMRCPCGKKLQVPQQYAGKRVKCPGCGKALQIPSGRSEKAPAAVDPVLEELFDEVELTPSKTGHRCPMCREDLAPDDILCVHCGYHLEWGKKLRTRRIGKEPK